MTYRLLPTAIVTQAQIRAECLELQDRSRRSYNQARGYQLEMRWREAQHQMEIYGSAKLAAITGQRLGAVRSAEERYMRGLNEGLVLDDPGPACSVCGGRSNVVHMGGSIPYLCDNPECIPF